MTTYLLKLKSRFWRKVEKTPTCWIWVAGKFRNGRGAFIIKGKTQYAYRVAWELTYGFIPSGLEVCHKCDNPHCVNPDHLFLGTHQDNMNDMVSKKRSRSGEFSPKAKLTWIQVEEIRNSPESQKTLAKRYSVSRQLIGKIKRLIYWRTKHEADASSDA